MATEPAANTPPPPADQPTQATTASRCYVLALLVLINVLSYVDRHMLPAFAAQITVELNLSRQQFGLLTGFAFVTVYALSGPVMGVLADRFNPSRVIAWGIALWSAMTWLTGLSRNFLQILLPRMAVGIGEATLHPAAAGILSRLFAPTQRATVFGLFFMGSHIGLGLAYWLAGTLGEAIGWRMMFMVLGAVGLVLALVLLASARFKPKAFAPPVDPSANDDNAVSVRKVVRELLDAVRHNAAFRQAVLGISLLHAIYAIGLFSDLLEARQVAAPLTKVLLGADLVVLLAIILYVRLHRRILTGQSEAERPASA